MAVDLERRYRRAGIADGFRDAFGNWRETPETTRAAIYRALDHRKTAKAGRRPETPRAQPAYLPPEIEAGGRIWGFAIQLYGLRSARNWGMGDFTDLANFARRAADLGAQVIALNPLHALFPGNPAHISPYSPSSRIFRNPLYLDVTAVPDFDGCEDARKKVESAGFRKAVRQLRDTALVDHVRVAAHKLPILEILYDRFRGENLIANGGAQTSRGKAFRRFQATGGEALERFAVFEAIAEQSSAGYDWCAWPAELRSPSSAGVATFAKANRRRVEYHQYLQWEVDRQLAAAQAVCRDCHMTTGLLHDLAVGFDGSGADSWILQDSLCPSVSIGAPPDQLSPDGQNWGFPPFNPFDLEQNGFAPFIQTLSASMAHGGGLRIDHVLGFARQYWVPHGVASTEGAYVSFPLDKLVSVTADASRRASCLVVGEDLGTVPEGFRERMAKARLLSYRLAYFERDRSGRLPAPDGFPRLALTAGGTHDLPTLSGFWCGRDIELRKTLGFFARQDIEKELRAARDRDRKAIWQALVSAGLLPGVSPGDPPPAEANVGLAAALYAYLAESQSCLMIIQPEDLLGTREQINLPGVVDGHPNWRRKMEVTIEEFGTDARITEACGKVAAARRAAKG